MKFSEHASLCRSMSRLELARATSLHRASDRAPNGCHLFMGGDVDGVDVVELASFHVGYLSIPVAHDIAASLLLDGEPVK